MASCSLITDAGRAALGLEPDGAAVTAAEAGDPAPATETRSEATGATQGATSAPAGKSREGTKQALLIGMLDRPEGATIDEIVAATGWQPHTVRGAFAGALKKRLGLTVTSEKREGRGRVYRIVR